MKNFIILLVCFISISMYGQGQGEVSRSDCFVYGGFGAGLPNTIEKLSFEGYVVVGMKNNFRLSLDVSGFNIPSQLPENYESNEAENNWRDSIMNFSFSLGKTLLDSKFIRFSADGGMGILAINNASFDKVEDRYGRNSYEVTHVGEKFTVGLNVKTRLEFKITDYYGVVLNASRNFNTQHAYQSYGIGFMYGVGLRNEAQNTASIEESRNNL